MIDRKKEEEALLAELKIREEEFNQSGRSSENILRGSRVQDIKENRVGPEETSKIICHVFEQFLISFRYKTIFIANIC